MKITMDTKDYIGKMCVVNSHGKRYCGKYDGMRGTIERPGSCNLGIKLVGLHNEASGYGTFWFHKGEVELVGPLEQMLEETVKLSQGGIIAEGFSVISRSVRYSEEEETTMPTRIEEMRISLKIVELAKERDLKAINDSKAYQTNVLLDTDDVVVALENKRANEGKTPLGYVQKVGIVTKETDEAIKLVQEKAAKECHEIEVKYEELYAALELPEVNTIEVLKAAGILNEDGTGLANPVKDNA